MLALGYVLWRHPLTRMIEEMWHVIPSKLSSPEWHAFSMSNANKDWIHTQVLFQTTYCPTSCVSCTGILYLARRSKYHISIWPLSRGELIPMLD